jgi:glycosyltransferase involved in cell wall biosynthesis
MNELPSISVAIITKNRLTKLKNCLFSLKQQTLSPSAVIVIDNDDKKSAKKTTNQKNFKKLNIIYYHLPKKTVPACRNRALKLNNHQYLAFIDDDCIADQNWLKEASKTLQKKQGICVLGKTTLTNSQNIFALAQHARDNFWKNYNLQVFDTKNVLINSLISKKYQLKFDENCQSKHYDSADFDFDFQLKTNGLKKYYNPKMLVSHYEVESLKKFKQRSFHRGKLGKYLNDKWQLNNQLVNLRDTGFIFFSINSLKNLISNYKKYKKYIESNSFLKKILAVFFIRIFEKYYLMGYVEKK